MTHKQCPHCSEALVCPGHGAVQRPLVAPCPTRRGGLWVSVHDPTGVEAPGVPVVVAGTTTTTDEAGIAAFDPLDDGTYAVQLGKLPPTVAERFAPPAVPSIDGISVTQGKIMHAELVLRRRPTLEVRVSPPVDATVTITHGDGSKRSAKTKGGVADFGTVEVGVYNVQVQRGGDGPGDGRGNGDGERAEVGYGDHRQVAVELPQTVNPVIDIEDDRDALAVGAAATTVTLHADGAFQGRGQLRVTAGANHIRVLQGGQPLVLQNGRRDFRNIDQTGVQVQLEATSASALQGVKLEWELFSDNVECGDPATEDLTAVAATLVIHDRAGHAIDRATARGNGRILAKGPSAQRRAKVTVRCQPAQYTGQLKLVDRNGNNLALYAAAAGGNALPLPHQLPSPVPAQGVNLYVEGIQPSAAAAGDALDLAIEGVANRADHVVLTVVEATLEVCGPRPNDGEPPPLTEADKRNPGRELIGQAWTHRSPRARVRVRKNPTDARCTLRLRPPAGNEVSLFEAEDHVEGEVATGLPYSITAAAFDTAHGETGDGLVLWAEGREEAATPTQLSLDVQDIADDCDAIGFTVRMATVEVEVERRDAAALTGEVRVNLYPSHGDDVLFSAPVDGEGKVQLQVPPAPYRVGIAPADGLDEAGFRILRKPPGWSRSRSRSRPPAAHRRRSGRARHAHVAVLRARAPLREDPVRRLPDRDGQVHRQGRPGTDGRCRCRGDHRHPGPLQPHEVGDYPRLRSGHHRPLAHHAQDLHGARVLLPRAQGSVPPRGAVADSRADAPGDHQGPVRRLDVRARHRDRVDGSAARPRPSTPPMSPTARTTRSSSTYAIQTIASPMSPSAGPCIWRRKACCSAGAREPARSLMWRRNTTRTGTSS